MGGVEGRVLDLLLSRSGEYVSGSEIAELLGVSRPTVHRAVECLRDYGYVIESHPRKGYRLIISDDLRSADHYLSMISGRTRVKYRAYYVECCRSTQDVAEALAREGAGEGIVVIAEEMSAGRGRLGREWVATRGGLWFTVLLRPERLEGIQLITLGAGVAVAKSLRKLHGIKAGLKWPNDVLVNGRKISGVLVEGRFEADRPHYLLVGVGVNVNNELPEDLRKEAVTVKELVGHEVPRIPLLNAIIINLDRAYEMIVRGLTNNLLSEWRELSLTLGRVVEVKGDKVVRGRAVDVDSDGALLINVKGKLIRVLAGDVIHLRSVEE